MRTLKITALAALLTVVLLAIAMAWLVRSEQGSRWLLQQGLGALPVTIEASGISGTLAEGLGVQSLFIALPSAEIRASKIVISWRPVNLLAGIVDIESAQISALSVDILESESSGEPIEDELFWLQLPLYIDIESGRLNRLRIEEAEFENLSVAGGIGRGRLDIESLHAQTAGIELQAGGELAGPAPGRLNAVVDWNMPAENLNGSGSFNGNIDKLDFSHLIHVPEKLDFNGSIYDLFSAPRLDGVAEWSSIRVPGEAVLYSKAGRAAVSSDFRSVRLQGDNTVLLEGWPQAPMQLEAVADLQAITIDAYSIELLDGRVTGLGRIEYGQDLQGWLQINGLQIDAGLIHHNVPGRLDFKSTLRLESSEALAIDVATANAHIADKDVTGHGRVQLQQGRLTAIAANLSAGTNTLKADVTGGKHLSGSITADAPVLAMIWPGLQGSLDASIVLGGSPEKPQARVKAKATAVSFGPHSMDRFELSGELQSDQRITGRVAATGLVADKQRVGNLDFKLNGTVAAHRSVLELAGGVVEVYLSGSGGWDGNQYTQTFEKGRIRPEGLDSWELKQHPKLRLSAESGQVSAHCWKQHEASLCIDDSNWDADSLQSSVVIKDFTLASLQPLLTEGYSIDGAAEAELKFMRDKAGLQAEVHWRQSRTVVAYSDNIDTLQTTLDMVQIDLISDDSRTRLDAKLSGEQGLNMTARADVNGPLAAESPLEAAAKGRLPSIGLLRPLVQRLFDPGELKGDLTIDLGASGTLGDPLFNGGAYLSNGTLGLLDVGVTFTDINIAAQSRGTDKLMVTGNLRSGRGRAEIRGEVRAVEDTDLVADIRIQGENLAIVRVPDLSVDTSPDLRLNIGQGVFDISGTVVIPHATAQIHELPKSAVPKSGDVIVHGPDRTLERQKETIITGNVDVVLGDDVNFSGFGLTSRLDGGLRLTQKRRGHLRSGGTVRVREGFLTGYGKELRVDRGELTFTGPLDDPLINIQVSRESIYEGRQYTIGLRLTGSARNVKTEPFSRPALSERDVLSFLLLDRPASSDSDASGAALALGLQQLLPDQSGRFGLDEVSFETNDANEAAMVAGKRINENLYVRYVFGTLGEPGAFRIRYRLGRGFSLEASTGSSQSLDLIYLLER